MPSATGSVTCWGLAGVCCACLPAHTPGFPSHRKQSPKGDVGICMLQYSPGSIWLLPLEVWEATKVCTQTHKLGSIPGATKTDAAFSVLTLTVSALAAPQHGVPIPQSASTPCLSHTSLLTSPCTAHPKPALVVLPFCQTCLAHLCLSRTCSG